MGVGVCYPQRSATDAVPASLSLERAHLSPGSRQKFKGFLQLRGINHERGKASLDGSSSSGRRVFSTTRGFNPALPAKPHVSTRLPATTLLSSTNFGFRQNKRAFCDPSTYDTTSPAEKETGAKNEREVTYLAAAHKPRRKAARKALREASPD